MVSRAFQPIKPQENLKNRVVTILTEAMFQGKIRPGERINESQIARQLHVSRAPVREALQQLQEQGLIENVARRGMFVVALSDEDIQKINSLRVVLEAEALRLARERYTLRSEGKLAELIEGIERATGSPFEMTRLDFELHRTIWSLGHNEYLERALANLTAPLFAHAALTLTRGKRRQMVLNSHRPLLEFLRGHTKESAEEVMIRHLSAAWSDPLKFSSRLLQEIKSRLGTED